MCLQSEYLTPSPICSVLPARFVELLLYVVSDCDTCWRTYPGVLMLERLCATVFNAFCDARSPLSPIYNAPNKDMVSHLVFSTLLLCVETTVKNTKYAAILVSVLRIIGCLRRRFQISNHIEVKVYHFQFIRYQHLISVI